MKIFRIAQENNQDITSHPDFAGFHCQKYPLSKYDGIIPNDEHYAEAYYFEILQNLTFDMLDKANRLGLLDQPEDKYSEEFLTWKDDVHEFLQNNNIRWTFVSANKPLEEYGSYQYYVLIPESEVIAILDDINVNDRAYAYIYDGNKVTPKYIEIEE